MGVVWITEAPDFRLDGDAVTVSLRSGPDEIIIRLSRHHVRTAVNDVTALLDEAEMAEERSAMVYAFARKD